MQFSTDARHAATLEFLAEVRDYLARLPVHPMNRRMLEKIEAHLHEPVHNLIQSGIKPRSGMSCTAAGTVSIAATLEGDRLTVTTPAKGKGLPDDLLLKRLREGISLNLKPDLDTRHR